VFQNSNIKVTSNSEQISSYCNLLTPPLLFPYSTLRNAIDFNFHCKQLARASAQYSLLLIIIFSPLLPSLSNLLQSHYSSSLLLHLFLLLFCLTILLSGQPSSPPLLISPPYSRQPPRVVALSRVAAASSPNYSHFYF
jgi:hypothetical protein